MSKNISKFARPVFLRPVFRPTPISDILLPVCGKAVDL
jgi:hypothetical protein